MVHKHAARWRGLMANRLASSAISEGSLPSQAIRKGASENRVAWHSIDPGKLQQKAFIDLRGAPGCATSCVGAALLESLAEASRKRALWRHDNNNLRPHASFGNRTQRKRTRPSCKINAPRPARLGERVLTMTASAKRGQVRCSQLTGMLVLRTQP
jgi:hypothetical protein